MCRIKKNNLSEAVDFCVCVLGVDFIGDITDYDDVSGFLDENMEIANSVYNEKNCQTE